MGNLCTGKKKSTNEPLVEHPKVLSTGISTTAAADNNRAIPIFPAPTDTSSSSVPVEIVSSSSAAVEKAGLVITTPDENTTSNALTEHVSPVNQSYADAVKVVKSTLTAQESFSSPLSPTPGAVPVELSAIQRGEIPDVKTGFLLKQGATFKNMVSRYFILEEGILLNFANEVDAKIQWKRNSRSEKAIHLKGSKVLTIPGKSQFIIEVYNKKYVLEVEDKNQYDSWLKALQTHAAYANIQSTKSSQEPTLNPISESRQNSIKSSQKEPSVKLTPDPVSSSRNSSLKINATEPSTLITETAKSVNSVVDSTVAAVVAGETAVIEETKVTSE